LDNFTCHDLLYATLEVSGGRVGGVESKSVGSDNFSVKKLERVLTSGANFV